MTATLGRRLIAFVLAASAAVPNLGQRAAASPTEVEVSALKASIGTSDLVNAAGERAAGTILAVKPVSGSARLYVRICSRPAPITCSDYFKEISDSEYQMPGGAASIKSEISELGEIDVKIVSDTEPSSAAFWAYHETRSAVSITGDYGEDESGVALGGVQWGSTIGPWTTTTGNQAFNSRNVRLIWHAA